MQLAGVIKAATVSGVFGICLALAMITFTTQNARATPKIANGKPCGTCHAGSPPSKSNLKH